MGDSTQPTEVNALLTQILSKLDGLQQENKTLASSIDVITGRVNALAGVKAVKDAAKASTEPPKTHPIAVTETGTVTEPEVRPTSPTEEPGREAYKPTPATSRIILTTYPGQSGIDPIIMNWGEKDPMQRGPVVVSRASGTVRRRNGTLLLSHFPAGALMVFRFSC